MAYRRLVLLMIALIFTSCSSNPKNDSTNAEIDISSSALVTIRSAGIATNMIAEVVSILNIETNEQIYKYDIYNRKDIERATFSVPPGRYRITSICNDRQFVERYSKLIEVQLKDQKYWWVKFESAKGTDGFLPGYSFEVNVSGGELVTAVNMAGTGNKSCSVIYGHKKLNGLPKTSLTDQEFRSKYANKFNLYN